MDVFQEIKDRLAALERKVSSMVRVGVVDTVDRTKCRVTVTFDVPGGQGKSWNLPVLVKWAVTSSDYDMPDVGEQVTCIFLPNGPEVGFVLGSFYSDEDPIPEGAEAEGVRAVELADGSRFDYSTETSTGHALVGDVEVEIAADHVRLLVGDLETEFTDEHVRMGGSSATQPFVRGTDHKTLLSAILDLLAAHTHPTGVGPSGPPANASSLTAKKADIDATLSTIIKGR